MFNALQYTQKLEKAGFTREQSEASVNLVIETMNENFATKTDLNELRAATKADLNELRTATKADLNELRSTTKADLKELELRMDVRFQAIEFKMDSRFQELELKMESRFKAQDSKFESGYRELEYRLMIKLGSLMVVFVTFAVGTTATVVKLIQSSG